MAAYLDHPKPNDILGSAIHLIKHPLNTGFSGSVIVCQNIDKEINEIIINSLLAFIGDDESLTETQQTIVACLREHGRVVVPTMADRHRILAVANISGLNITEFSLWCNSEGVVVSAKHITTKTFK